MTFDTSWRCTFDGTTLLVGCEGQVTAHEVRQYACRRLGCEPASVEMVHEISEKYDVALRWTGDDYARGGTPDRRRMQERAFDKEEWRDV